MRWIFYFFIIIIISISHGILIADPDETNWQKPGCHKVGHTRQVSFIGCISFDITTNACRGYCESWAIPSATLNNNEISQPITSIGNCCNIMETQPIKVRVLCKDGIRNYEFKSAVSCSCYHCKKD